MDFESIKSPTGYLKLLLGNLPNPPEWSGAIGIDSTEAVVIG